MNKRLYIILVCFIISIIFWLLIALSHDYLTTITFPVNYLNLPGKKVVINELPSNISVNLKTTGFKIMSFGFQKAHEPIEIDVSTSLKNAPINTDVLALPTKLFLSDFSREIGAEVEITGFVPDSIIFNFSDLITRRIPVFLNYKASFEKQFDSTGSPVVSPEFIDVSGPPSVVNQLNYIHTEAVTLTDLKGTVKQKAKLIKNRNTSYNLDEVEFTLPVEKFTEGSVEIEVNPMNVKEGYSLKTFPDKVKVRYMVALSRYNKINKSMFDAVVDASDLEKSHPSKLSVKLVTTPSIVRTTLIEPENVDYILRKQ
jgi:YbbR domain-containing protein